MKTYQILADQISRGVALAAQRRGVSPLIVIEERKAKARDPLMVAVLSLAAKRFSKPRKPRKPTPAPVKVQPQAGARTWCQIHIIPQFMPGGVGVRPIPGLFQAPRKEKVTLELRDGKLPMESLLAQEAARHQRRNVVQVSTVYEDAPPTARADRERAEARVMRHVGSRIVHPQHNTKQRWALS